MQNEDKKARFVGFVIPVWSFSEIPNPRLLAGVRDHYDSDALKEHILEVGMDPSPGKRRRDSGFQKKS